jgi:hypothetical protein
MAYIYQADVWCDKCGEHIKAELARNGTVPDDPEDESSYDSDEYPKSYDAENGEADSPQNCADGRCGGFANGHGYGTFLQNRLTGEGYRYLKGILDEHGAGLPEYAQEWADYYQFEYHAQEWDSAHEWLFSHIDSLTFGVSGPIGNLVSLAKELAAKLDGDTIQDLYQSDMDEDGFFKESGWYSSEMEDS